MQHIKDASLESDAATAKNPRFVLERRRRRRRLSRTRFFTDDKNGCNLRCYKTAPNELKMEKKDIEHLATLARIELTGKEAGELSGDITSILEYVGTINKITAQRSGEKSVRALHNVVRDDDGPHEGGIYTEALLEAAPKRSGRHVQVKKILNNE